MPSKNGGRQRKRERMRPAREAKRLGKIVVAMIMTGLFLPEDIAKVAHKAAHEGYQFRPDWRYYQAVVRKPW